MPRKIDSRAMRELNRSIVLDMIRRKGSISRTDLARLSSLTKPTVGAIVDGLLATGVIHEVGVGKALKGGGRPARLLALNGESAAYGALSFRAGKLAAGICDATGNVRSVLDLDLPMQGPARAMERGLTLLRSALGEAGLPWSKLSGIGVAVAGAVDGGVVMEAPHVGFAGFDVSGALEPLAIPVVVHSACNASAIAEGRIGVARGCQSFVWVDVDRGLCAGIVIHGRPVHGRGGFAGEIGRWNSFSCGRTLEDLASEAAIERGFGQTSQHEPASVSGLASNILEAASAGNETALAVVREVSEHLGVGVSHLFDLLSPDVVVIGGRLAGVGEVVLESVVRGARKHGLRSAHGAILLSTLGDDASIKGALLAAVDLGEPSIRLISTTARASAG